MNQGNNSKTSGIKTGSPEKSSIESGESGKKTSIKTGESGDNLGSLNDTSKSATPSS